MIKNTYFRYRHINDYTLNSLLSQEFYVTTPNKFNDPFDSTFSYDLNIIVEKIIANAVFLKNVYIYSFFQEHKRLPNDKETQDAVKDMKQDSNALVPIIGEYAINALNFLRKEFFVGCLSKNIDDTTLWSHYADCGKGFALEYEDKELELLIKKYFSKLRYKKELFNLFDVTYELEEKDKTVLMLDIIESFSEYLVESLHNSRLRFRFEPTKDDLKDIFTHKSFNWQYEKEVRLIAPNPNLNKEYGSLGKIKPLAIYLGHNIEQHNKYLISKYCEENDISLFQMKINFEKGGSILAKEKLL